MSNLGRVAGVPSAARGEAGQAGPDAAGPSGRVLWLCDGEMTAVSDCGNVQEVGGSLPGGSRVVTALASEPDHLGLNLGSAT